MPLQADTMAASPLGTPRGQDTNLTIVRARNPARARYAVLNRIGPLDWLASKPLAGIPLKMPNIKFP